MYMIKEMINVIIAPEWAWARFAKDYPIGPWTGYIPKCYIQLVEDAEESTIEETLSHETIHCVLFLIGEALSCQKLEFLWYRYKELKIPMKIKKFLKGLAYSGIGFP